MRIDSNKLVRPIQFIINTKVINLQTETHTVSHQPAQTEA
jgi:hypothetical protein